MGSFSTYFSEEPGNNVTENDSLVGLVVTWWGWNASNVPEIRLPLIEMVVGGAGVEEQNSWSTVNEPASVGIGDAPLRHRIQRVLQWTIFDWDWLNLNCCLYYPLNVSISATVFLFHHPDPKERTEARLRGPMRVYLSPYSRVVIGAFDFNTE